MIRIKSLSKKQGFTLVETLAAAAVLAISLLAAGLAIYVQFTFITRAREKAIASLAAQEEIESIRGMPFDNIINLGTSFTASGFTYLHNPVGALAIQNIQGDNNQRKVSVTVSWRSATGVDMQQKLVTFMTRNGINKQ